MEFRHELKHYLNYSDYLVLHQRLKATLKTDEHVNETGQYKIRSLYFDNQNDKALREKIYGINVREKFRLRYYNDDPSLIYLEKKSKINGLCKKYKTPLAEKEVQAILAGDVEWMKKSRDALVLELYSKMQSQQLRPKTIVEYTREPFVYCPGNVRITLDKDIKTGLFSTDFFNPALPLISAGEQTIILEVKYDDFLPDIIKNIIQVGNRKTTACSKYAACRIYG